jgi:Calcineurin-like phosphoesterase superfamily domain
MNEYLFEDRPLSSFQRLAAKSETDVLVFGHTHKPYSKRVDGVLFINAGSVGKPKDGDPRACYVVLDTTGEVDAEFAASPTTFRQSPRPSVAVSCQTSSPRIWKRAGTLQNPRRQPLSAAFCLAGCGSSSPKPTRRLARRPQPD